MTFEETKPEIKALMDWLNQYAFVAWLRMNHRDLGIEDIIEMSEKQTDDYQALIDEFHNEKLLVIEETRAQNNDRERSS